jgi:putative membrane protein
MLWDAALVLYLHIISFMLTYAAVAAEYALLRGDLDAPTARALGVADAVYGVSAVVVFATGVVQVLYYGKGYGYYIASPLLWSKVGLFSLVGLASVYPTMTFLRWQAELGEGSMAGAEVPARRLVGLTIPTVSAPRLPRLRAVVLAELGLLTVLPLLGSALHYGLG